MDIDAPSIHVGDGNPYISNFTEADAAVIRVVGEAEDDPDEGAVRLAYMWARWVARRKLGENNASIDVAKIESLISDTIRALQHASQVRKCHTMARKGIEEAGEHLDTMTREIKSTMDELRSEIENKE